MLGSVQALLSVLDRIFGSYREWEFCERLRKGAERHEVKMREIQAEQTARHWRNRQLVAAIEQRQRELDQELLAILKGEPVVRDPSTYN